MMRSWQCVMVAALCMHSCTEKAVVADAIPPIEEGKCLKEQRAAVACAHPEAARIGAQILAYGGNAADAAVAMQWALAVCFPEAGNLGGGGLMVARTADGSSYALDFRESAPSAAHRNVYLNPEGQLIEGMSTRSPQSAGIPGTVHGLYEMHTRLGLLPMDSLLAPAIRLAANGFPITAIQANNLNRSRDAMNWANGIPTPFSPEGKQWQAGDSLQQPELAATLERIRQRGPSEFYAGETAQLLVQRTMQTNGDPWFTLEDLQNYQAIWRTPIRCDFDSIGIIGMPPPSSGGIALCQLLDMYLQLKADTLTHNSVAYIHTLVELQRRVYADRAEHLGDPGFHPVPVAGLLDSKYLREHLTSFDPLRATPSTDIKSGTPFAESTETTHLSVADAEGNAVAVTTTLNDLYGSKVVVHGAGFFLNNEMDDFSVKPGLPNMYGLIGGEANAIAPGKRMLSSMTPTIVLKNDALYLVAGSPGGSTIITSVLQTVLNAVYHAMPLSEVINAPKFHSQWLPDLIMVEEGRFDSLTVNGLKAMGHEFRNLPSLGRVDAIMVQPDGRLDACGDTRSDNTAAGYR